MPSENDSHKYPYPVTKLTDEMIKKNLERTKRRNKRMEKFVQPKEQPTNLFDKIGQVREGDK